LLTGAGSTAAGTGTTGGVVVSPAAETSASSGAGMSGHSQETKNATTSANDTCAVRRFLPHPRGARRCIGPASLTALSAKLKALAKASRFA
jgi:hypothetical protein